VAGLESVQGPEEDGHRDVEPRLGGTLLQQLREVHAGIQAGGAQGVHPGVPAGPSPQPEMVGILRDWPPFSADWWAILPGTV
jgi:hypothetical protein